MSLNFPTQIRRLNAIPLSESEVFDSLGDFEAYVNGDSQSYNGQICKVVANNEVKIFIIDENASNHYIELNTFDNLTDVSDLKINNTNKFVKVNSNGTSLEYTSINLSIGTHNDSTLVINNSAGDNVTIPIVDDSKVGLMPVEHYNKLNLLNISQTATVNELKLYDKQDNNNYISFNNGKLEISNGTSTWQIYVDDDGDLIQTKI